MWKFFGILQSLGQFSQATKGVKAHHNLPGSSSSVIIKGGNQRITSLTPFESLQRRRFLHLLSSYDQQNKSLHRELANEKRRRISELDSVINSLLVFEAKLKKDMKTAGQRLLERDMEICRLVRLNCVLRKRLESQKQKQSKISDRDQDDLNCMVLEALQCNTCRKKFYEVELNEKKQHFSKEISLDVNRKLIKKFKSLYINK